MAAYGTSKRGHYQDGAFSVRLLRGHVTAPLEAHAERPLLKEGKRVAVARRQHDGVHRRAWMAEGREIGVLGGASELLPGCPSPALPGCTAKLMRPRLCSGAGRASALKPEVARPAAASTAAKRLPTASTWDSERSTFDSAAICARVW